MIPGGWEIVSLDELYDFSNGINADKSAFGSGVPFINVLEVITRETLDDSLIPGRVTLSASTVKRYQVRHGDVLFNRTSETQDEVALSSVYLGDSEPVFGGFVFRAQPKTKRLLAEYAAYALRARYVREQLVARGQGGIRANVSQRDLKATRVLLPSIKEQQAITEALADASEHIAALEKAIAKKQAMKEGMKQQLLTGRTRLPGFEGRWTHAPFGALAAPSRERVNPKNVPGDTQVVELEHLGSGTGQLVGASTASHAGSLKAEFRPGDVLFGKLRAYLRKYWLADSEGLCSTEFWVLRPKDDSVNEFIRYVIEMDGFIEAASGGYGTHMPRADWRVVSKIEVAVPGPAEQRTIARVLAEADQEIGALRLRLAKARDVKQGMMQQLLTGRIRLRVQE